MRGSRLAGMVSIKNVTVPGSAARGLEQLASSSKKVRRAKQMKGVDEVEEPALAPLHPLAPFLRIDHLTEYSGVFGTRCTTEVGRTAVKSLIGQDGEGESFLGVFGYAQVCRRNNLDAGKPRPELRHQQRIMGATAGDDQLLDLRA